MTDFDTIENDTDVCKAIVASMRLYICICKDMGKLPQVSHMVEIAYGLDAGTQALIALNKMDDTDDTDDTDDADANEGSDDQ